MTELTVTVAKETDPPESEMTPTGPAVDRGEQREAIMFSLTLANMILLLTLIAVLAILLLPSIVAAILTGCLGGAVSAFILVTATIRRAT